MMPRATELTITEIDVDVDGADAFAPPIGPEWEAVATGEHHVTHRDRLPVRRLPPPHHG